MLARDRSLIVLSTLAVACGARSDLDGSRSQGGSDAAGGGEAGGTVIPCEAEGVRLCGEPPGCPSFRFEECKGVSCTAAGDRATGAPLDVGVCWPDLPDWTRNRCVACDEGDACVHDEQGELFCAPFGVCERLWELGATTACRYADKSAFTNRPLAKSSWCLEDSRAVCGGTCAPCRPDATCVGRSDVQPFGLCVGSLGGELQCSPDDTASCVGPLSSCAVFVVPAVDQPVANRFGVCVPEASCFAAEAAGLVRCF